MKALAIAVGMVAGGVLLGGSWLPGWEPRSEQLDVETKASIERKLRKRTIAAAWIRNDVSTAEAVNRFETILAEEPMVLQHLRSEHPGESDAELARRNLTAYVRVIQACSADAPTRIVIQADGVKSDRAAQ
jgi:hypothetical protein